MMESAEVATHSEKITQAVILKIQTTFQGGKYVLNSLRVRRKLGPATPTRGTSVITDEALKAIEPKTVNIKYKAQLVHYFRQDMDFEDN